MFILTDVVFQTKVLSCICIFMLYVDIFSSQLSSPIHVFKNEFSIFVHCVYCYEYEFL